MSSGIIIINKPEGYTSFDAVAVMRGILGTRKVGHSGTLDPMATGVLPVFFGKATRAFEFAADHDKEYKAQILFGRKTDTGDRTGSTVDETEKRITRRELEEGILPFLGETEQIPPMYSAVKINGKKLYELARKGKTVERPARKIKVDRIDILSFDESTQTALIQIACSSGTYIRTLCEDIAERTGTFATLTALTRTRSGRFTIEEAADLEALRSGKINAADRILPVDLLFEDFPQVRVTESGAQRIAHGAFVEPEDCDSLPDAGICCRVYGPDGTFLMLGEKKELDRGGDALFCRKMF